MLKKTIERINTPPESNAGHAKAQIRTTYLLFGFAVYEKTLDYTVAKDFGTAL